MKLKHKTPCADCPWRKNSAQGFLGGFSPEFYADAVQMNEIPACHNKDFGPDSPKSAMCVGALATAANNCISPYKTDGAIEARKVIGKLDFVFQSVRDFYEYHAEKQYIHPLYRLFKK